MTSTQRKVQYILRGQGCEKKIVLSLDGGGIRGYSSLLIVEAIMARVDEVERKQNGRPSFPTGEEDPLPAHYFDYAFGTSTGGLIAIMLGQLRMPIERCLIEYQTFGKKVFGFRRPHWYQYSSTKFEKVIKEVIKGYSKERDENVFFVQPDTPQCSCRTAVMAVRRNPDAGDDAALLRNYTFTGKSHNVLDKSRPLNPDGHGCVYIWQAARATSAAPHFFREIEINGNRFMDGGVKMNNPSLKAWSEVNAMHYDAEPRSSETKKTSIGLFISIGTGLKASLSLFNERNVIGQLGRLLSSAVMRLSETEDTQVAMQEIAAAHDVPYFRFNVERGLENMRMDDCQPDTLLNIQNATKAYLCHPETKQRVWECAELLVAYRRGRGTRLRDSGLGVSTANFTHSRDGINNSRPRVRTPPTPTSIVARPSQPSSRVDTNGLQELDNSRHELGRYELARDELAWENNYSRHELALNNDHERQELPAANIQRSPIAFDMLDHDPPVSSDYIVPLSSVPHLRSRQPPRPRTTL